MEKTNVERIRTGRNWNCLNTGILQKTAAALTWGYLMGVWIIFPDLLTAEEEKENKWFDRVRVSGFIEVEAGISKIDYGDPAEADRKKSDADLASAGVAVDVSFSPYAEGHVLFKYEDDDVFVDEGFITLTGAEKIPAYLIAGKQYLPFGNFETHFISDPITLELGETNEGGMVIGYRPVQDLVDINVSVFNGKTGKAGSDDIIENYTARVMVTPLKTISLGTSYTSNLAAADSFSDEIQTGLKDYVAGWSIFMTALLSERFTVYGEYLAALESFEPGEIYDATDTGTRNPGAWNLELGYAVTENFQVALCYGGSTDGGAFLPQKRYGTVANWGLFENTSLALEYLRTEFEDGYQTVDAVTVQLAIEF
ncbi:MAG: hypothetical protein A2277_02135 [Desulfobacterales bacterium RIFOXYA12_FULL_46_15]|nr:MAG: hypothetical protein A2277_02135 [Desulfobacterales bacterium RIFOXYA12_FULL_46_15]